MDTRTWDFGYVGVGLNQEGEGGGWSELFGSLIKSFEVGLPD